MIGKEIGLNIKFFKKFKEDEGASTFEDYDQAIKCALAQARHLGGVYRVYEIKPLKQTSVIVLDSEPAE